MQPLAKQPLALKKSHQEPEEKQKVSDDERPEESELQSVVASMEAAVAKATQSLTNVVELQPLAEAEETINWASL